MPNDPELERLRLAEQHVLAAAANGPVRLPVIIAHVREALANPQAPEAEILTAICNLSDLGKLVPRTLEGYLHYATPAAWQKHATPTEASNA
jgi:hypothetical protein